MSDENIEVEEFLKQWKFGGNSDGMNILSQAKFEENNANNSNMFNNKSQVYLQWEKQSAGINLGWTDNAGSDVARKVSRWILYLDQQAGQPIKFGDAIALGYGTSPSFYRYASRTIGINLENVKGPAFQWKILGGRVGEPVVTGQWVAIFNTKAKNAEGNEGDFLLRHKRAAGANIGWTSSPDTSWPGLLKTAGKKAAEKGLEVLMKKYGG